MKSKASRKVGRGLGDNSLAGNRILGYALVGQEVVASFQLIGFGWACPQNYLNQTAGWEWRPSGVQQQSEHVSLDGDHQEVVRNRFWMFHESRVSRSIARLSVQCEGNKDIPEDSVVWA